MEIPEGERALLMGIAKSPGDATPVRVYADWLEEHDQGIRAEFLRLMVELELGEARRHRKGVVNKRLGELFRDHHFELFPKALTLRWKGEEESAEAYLDTLSRLDNKQSLVHLLYNCGTGFADGDKRVLLRYGLPQTLYFDCSHAPRYGSPSSVEKEVMAASKGKFRNFLKSAAEYAPAANKISLDGLSCYEAVDFIDKLLRALPVASLFVAEGYSSNYQGREEAYKKLATYFVEDAPYVPNLYLTAGFSNHYGLFRHLLSSVAATPSLSPLRMKIRES